MRRRDVIALLGGAAVAWPFAARAQAASGRPLIGVLSPLSAATAARNIEALRAGLRDLGYVDGRNMAIEIRFADGDVARLPQLATELVALKPAVIVAGSAPAAIAARKATSRIPIAMAVNQNPVALGLAAGVTRPGGNVTGFWIEGDDALLAKRLELLKEAVPGTSRVGVMAIPDSATDVRGLKAVQGAIQDLGMTIHVYDVRTLSDLEAAFAAAVRDGLHAAHVGQDPLFNANRSEVAAMAARARLPTIYGFREFAVAGGLISYATSLPAVYWRFAGLLDKILKGAQPADLPIERPGRFELVVNLKTAKAMGLTIPETFLLRVDEVIE